MFKYTCLNPIADVGLDLFVKYYEKNRIPQTDIR